MDNFDKYFDVLSSQYAGRKSPYNKAQRYKDFREVFLSSEAGKRVYAELFRMAGFYSVGIEPGQPVNSHAAMMALGKRSICNDILIVLSQDPNVEKPRTANSKPNF